MSEETTLDDFANSGHSSSDTQTNSTELRVGPFEYSLPSEWDTASLSEACENKDGERVPVKKSERELMDGEIPYYGASGQIDTVDNFLFNERLLLLAEDGANLLTRNSPIAYIIEGKSWVNNHAHVLKPEEGHNIWYLAGFLEFLDYEPFVTGTAQPKLTQNSMGFLRVPKPPLSEQRKIATVIYTIDRAMEKNGEIIDQIRRIEKGVRSTLIPAGVKDHDYTSIRLGPEEFDIPNEWRHLPLSSVCRKITDGTHETPKVIDNGYPFVTSEDVNNGRINFNSGKYVSEDEHREIISRSKPEKGDILYTHIGSIGNVAQVDVDFEFSIKNVALFKPEEDIVTSDYLEIFLKTNIVENAVYRRLQGGVQDFLSITDLNKIPILVPPLDEQDEIVRIIKNISQGKHKEQACKQQLKRLKRGLMQDLLTGKVRTTDTNIEVPEEIAQYG